MKKIVIPTIISTMLLAAGVGGTLLFSEDERIIIADGLLEFQNETEYQNVKTEMLTKFADPKQHLKGNDPYILYEIAKYEGGTAYDDVKQQSGQAFEKLYVTGGKVKRGEQIIAYRLINDEIQNSGGWNLENVQGSLDELLIEKIRTEIFHLLPLSP